MKLHLPKALFTAVMALFAVSQTVWGGVWSDNTYSILDGDSITTLSTSDNANETAGAFIRAGADSVTATITELNHIAGKKLTISGTWGNATGTQGGQGYDLEDLTITTLNIKDGNGAYGSAALEIGTSMEESGDAVPEKQYVTIGTIKGTVSSLNVGKHGSLTLNALRYNNGTSNVNTFADNATVTVDGTLDLSGIAYSNGDGSVAFTKLMNVASGSGTIKLKAGEIQTTNSSKDDVYLKTNYVVDNGNLALTSHDKDGASWRQWIVTQDGSINVGTGTLSFLAGQKLKIEDGGEVTAATLALGHTTGSDDSAENTYSGALEMSGDSATLTVGSINIQNNGNKHLSNQVTLTGGTLKITGTTAITYSHSSGVLADVLIGGSGEESLILQTGDSDWSLSKSTTAGSTLTIGNITIDAANTNMITISDAELNGIITNNATAEGAGLTLSGAFTTSGNFITADQVGTTTTGFSSVVKLTGLGTSSNNIILADGITFNGMGIGEEGWQMGTDGYYYRTTSTSNVYHVYTGTTNVNDIGSAAVGETFIGYEVHNGATLETNVGEVQGLTVTLQEGATLAKTTGNGIGESTRQWDNIILAGDATVNAGKNFGLLAGDYAKTTLDLAGHTLTKTGSADFLLLNTEVTNGTINVQQGGLKFVTKSDSGAPNDIVLGDHVNIQVQQGAYVNIATDKLTSEEILAISGTGEVRTNANITLGTGTSALTGNGAIVAQSGTLTVDGTTIGILRTSGGTANVNANSTITKAYLTGTGVMAITDATLKNLRVEANGTVNITGSTTSIGVAGDTYDGRSAGLYAKDGVVNIGDGSASSTVTVTRLEFGDGNSTESVSGGTLNVKQNATLIVTGNNNGTEYKNASIIFGEWYKGSILNVDGNFYAKNAKAMVGDTSSTINIKDGGVVAVQGFGISSTKGDKTQLTNLNLEDGGKLILGSDGINCGQKGFTGVIGAGTIGISADTVTIAENIALNSTSGTTFDTTKYSWNDAGDAISQAADATGGTLTISGAISDHSVTTGEGEGATTTTTSGKLIVTGKGKVMISSSNNTYSGGTEVKGGATLEVAGQTTNALGSGAVDVKEQSTLKLDWLSSLAVDTINLSGGSTIDLENASSSDTTSLNTLNATINIEGTNTIKAGKNGNNTAVAGTIKGNGTLNLNNKGHDNTWLLQSTISDKSATEKLAISSNSDAIVSGTNTYTGGTTITGRTLTTASEKALGEGKVTVEGGTLKQDGSALKVTELEYKSGTVNNNGQALEVGTLTVGSTPMEMAGNGTTTVTDTLTVSNTNAFTMEGALVLTGATVDLSGFTLDTTTAQDTYVFTLGMATGGITADESISFTGIDVVGYTATLAAAAADPTASAVMLLDGAATNNYLVLTLTKDDDTTPLTTLNVTGVDVNSSSAGALTLTTAENAIDAVFGGALDAVMDDTTWADIKAELKEAGITLDDSIAITFVGADGKTFDFNGANDDLTAPTITINGEVTRDADLNAVEQTLTNNGTTVGNYVTAYIPEPTSTTLSLLALAALAVRRRRK